MKVDEGNFLDYLESRHDSFFTDYTIIQINTDKNNKDSQKCAPNDVRF